MPVVADVDADPADRGVEHRVAEVARAEVELLPELRQVRDVVLAVLAEQRAVGVDDRGGVVVLALVLDLVDRQHDDQAQFLGQRLEPLGRRAGDRLDVGVVLLVLDGAEVRAVEQLLEADDLRALRPRPRGRAPRARSIIDSLSPVQSTWVMAARTTVMVTLRRSSSRRRRAPRRGSRGPRATSSLGGRARRHDVRAVEVGERPQPALLAGGGELVHRRGVGAGGVERHERLAGLAVADQLERPEHAEPAHLADATGAGRRSRPARARSRRCRGARACSMMPSSSKMLIEATATAQASGWPE